MAGTGDKNATWLPCVLLDSVCRHQVIFLRPDGTVGLHRTAERCGDNSVTWL